MHGTRRISADTALRLARYFGTSERFWMNLQGRYDIEIERDRLADSLDDIHPLASPKRSGSNSMSAPSSVLNKSTSVTGSPRGFG